MNLRLKEVLKCLCFDHGWSYAVFWRANRENSMLLTLEASYCEQQIRTIIDKMVHQVHMLGEGIIGQAAFTGKHCWMFADTYYGEWATMGSVDNQDVFQDNSQLIQQFSSGIKTIAVISVAPECVVQFGSTHKIIERFEFAEQIRSLFRQPERVEGVLLSENAQGLKNEPNKLSGRVDYEFCSGTAASNYWNNNAISDDYCNNWMGKTQSSMTTPHYFPFTMGLQFDNIGQTMDNSSLNLKSQLQNDKGDAGRAISSLHNIQLQHVSTQMHSGCAENSATSYPTMSMWTTNQNSGSYLDALRNFQGDATTASYELNGLLSNANHTQFDEVNRPVESYQGNNIQHSVPLIHSSKRQLQNEPTSFNTYQEENRVNDQSEFIAQSPHQSIRSVSKSTPKSFCGIPANEENDTLLKSTTDTVSSLGLGYDGKENPFTLPMQLPSDADMLNSLGLTFVQNQEKERWDDIMVQVGSGSQSNLSNGTLEYVAEREVGSIPCPQQEFSAKYEQLMDGHIKKPSLGDHLSIPTVMGARNASVYNNQTQLAGLSCVDGRNDVLLTNGDPQRMNVLRNPKEATTRSQVGAWIDDSYGINVEPAVTARPQRSEEPARPTRKRARPGDNTRPRPRDRQQIQDRIKELRDLVPNDGKVHLNLVPNDKKCSIDALFGRTIKHIHFLGSVAKYKDKLEQADEPKIIGTESGVVLKDNSCDGGATWAFEIGGKTMVCPIIVEDLNPPGQLLVEMLCEDGGFFLEIAEIIRGIGLTILKGVMEVRGDKIWARFYVEANRNITRMDIFLSLVQLLQQAATGEINFNNPPSNVIETAVPFTMYQ